ncbi:MAG: AMP-binding protein, partial [Pseudonocardiaceae bacterium]
MSADLRLPDSIRTIPEALAFWAEQTPDAPALIVAGGATVTYDALWRDARRLAESLAQCGVVRHDRLALLVPEGPALALALLGTMAAAIAVPLHATLAVPEVRDALRRLDPAGVIVTPSLPKAIRNALRDDRAPLFELRT